MNKHTLTIILAIMSLTLGGYFFADFYKGNNTVDADKTLLVTGNCLPVDDHCEILGTDMEMRLKFQAPPSYQRLLPIELSSKTSLDDVSISLIIAGEETKPMKMKNTEDKKHWTSNLMPFAIVNSENMKIRLAVSYKSITHVAEFPIKY